MATEKKNHLYADFDTTFRINPITKDIGMVYDKQDVIESIKHLVMTNHYERPWQPHLGSNVDAYLFENVDSLTLAALESEIRSVVENHEPRVTIDTVKVVSYQNTIYVAMSFYLNNETELTVITMQLERTR